MVYGDIFDGVADNDVVVVCTACVVGGGGCVHGVVDAVAVLLLRWLMSSVAVSLFVVFGMWFVTFVFVL